MRLIGVGLFLVAAAVTALTLVLVMHHSPRGCDKPFGCSSSGPFSP